MRWIIQASPKWEHDPNDWVDVDASIEAGQILNEILFPNITIEGDGVILKASALHEMAKRIDSYAKGRRPA